MTTLDYFYKLSPLIIAILAFKWPRITLILVCLLLKWWVAAVGVVIVSVFTVFRIKVRTISEKEYKEEQEEENNDEHLN